MRFNTTCAGIVTLAYSGLLHGDWNVPNNPVCLLCKDGKPPGNPLGAASILLPGRLYGEVYKCGELHNMGKSHLITTQMCNPIRHFMARICECGAFKKPKKEWVAVAPP